MNAVALVQWRLWSLAENLKAEGSCTSDRKIEIFPWLSNIYRWRIYLWNVSYAFRKTAWVSVSGTRSLSVRAVLNWNKTIGFYILRVFKALHIKFVTCLEQIVLCTFSTAAQSVSSAIFSDALVSNYSIAYKEYIDILYKLDIPPSPSLLWWAVTCMWISERCGVLTASCSSCSRQ